MRSLLVVATVLLASACSGGGGSSDDAGDATVPAPAPSTATAPALPPESNAAGSETCDEVVAGINAFNEGDFDETVSHFEKAVPLAEAADDGSAAADELLEAVTYYAELAPGDYLDAAAGSPEFARWKAVTLGQCAGDGVEPPGSPDDTEAPGVSA